MSKTITTFLIDGNPKGPQYVFISNKLCKLLLIPRASLAIVNQRDELLSAAFYILLGEDEFEKPIAYLGETENFRDRIKDHESKKTFWQKALVFISVDGAMTKTEVKLLEYLAIKKANEAMRYSIKENKNTPKVPNLPEHQYHSTSEFFSDIQLLTSFIGCNIFEVIEKKNEILFTTKYRGCNATGFYNEEGFTVLKGSGIAQGTVPSFTWKEKREKEIKQFTINDGGKIILNVDKTFSSPSTAADFCIGSSNNGWLVWKDKNGQTLHDVHRKQLITL